MRHVVRVLFHLTMFPILCIIKALVLIVLTVVAVAWYFDFKHIHPLTREDFLDNLPDGTYCYHVVDAGPIRHEDGGGFVVERDYIYYQTFKDALLGRKTVKTFEIEVKEV